MTEVEGAAEAGLELTRRAAVARFTGLIPHNFRPLHLPGRLTQSGAVVILRRFREFNLACL
jgi:hypothetical protein